MYPFFMIDDKYTGFTKLTSRKVGDLQCIKVEIFKWMAKETYAWIIDMFNALRLE